VKAQEGLVDGRVLGLAIVRLMEIVGKAAKRVPKEGRSKHPKIPWTSDALLHHFKILSSIYQAHMGKKTLNYLATLYFMQ
jgi:uncharacterized protein with HEPN domain